MIIMLTLVLVLLSFFVFPFFSQPTRQGHSFFFLLFFFFLRTTELSLFYLHFVTSVLRKWFLESVYPTKPSQF